MDIEKTTSFGKSSRLYILKSLKIHFNPLQNVSPILLLKGLMMVTNEGRIDCFQMFQKRITRSNIAYFVHI